MNTIIFHTKMVDSLVEMLVETSDLSIFWYVVIFFKSEFEIFIIQRYISWLFMLVWCLIQFSNRLLRINGIVDSLPIKWSLPSWDFISVFLYKSNSYWCEFIFYTFFEEVKTVTSDCVIRLKEKSFGSGLNRANIGN